MKFQIVSILCHFIIFINAIFIMLTQMQTLRQPTKLLVQVIGVLSLLALVIAIYNYLATEKE
ncbi:hypothetical protein [Streptococcus halichoeri]|uniref:hypothetical protein n=1 Tax=Streptococcus halichoeri TaxID=254785 RepID=UPI000DB15D79|nr:hypothetical protein [Streptococcus halichoeri]PZO94078.1 MAG: hypothetical protein DI617_07385 [Streptococcus pyogenes]